MVLAFFSGLLCQAQQNKFGGSGIYNFGNKSLGLGLRAELPIEQIDLLEGVNFIPQVNYFLPGSPVTEFNLGAGLQLNAYSYFRWTGYGLLNFAYNGWINNEETEYRVGDFSNFATELGIGVSRQTMRCLHPFIEFRYNFQRCLRITAHYQI